MSEQQVLEKVRVGGRNYVRVGDLVKVKPSRPGKKDGYLGRLRKIVDTTLDGVMVDVAAVNSKRARDNFRTLPLARIERVAQTRGGKPVQA